MSIYLGTNLLAGVSTQTISNAHSLLDFKWTDHILNELSWLRADTFSWQSGDVYVAAYNHLVADATGTAQTETIGSYTITYYRANDGHKIVLADQEATVINIYNETGVAWYYILDTTNTRFKLPRTKFGFTGIREQVGNYVPETLPNISGGIRAIGAEISSAYGVFAAGGGAATVYNASYGSNDGFTFDASRVTSVYQNGAPVQQRSTQMYLYFYVGDYDVADVNGIAVANVDLSNLSSTGKETAAGLGMPSDSYTDLTVGASGSNYTAPANGWFTACVTGGSSHYCFIRSHDSRIGNSFQYNSGSGEWHCVTIPCKSGDIVTMQYGNCDFQRFAFVYAEGEENV